KRAGSGSGNFVLRFTPELTTSATGCCWLEGEKRLGPKPERKETEQNVQNQIPRKDHREVCQRRRSVGLLDLISRCRWYSGREIRFVLRSLGEASLQIFGLGSPSRVMTRL